MANYRAVANGNWSNLATWQDDSLGYFANSTVLPTSADNVYSNNFTVTIDGVSNANLITNNAFSPPTFLGAMSIPLMTSNTTPSGIANASSTTNFSGGIGPYGAFDRNLSTLWESAVATAWLSYQFPTGKIIKRYGFFSYFSNSANPRTWTFEGSNDGSTWTTLDTQTNFITTISTFYSFDISSNVTSYLYYRINISATQAVVPRGPIVMSLEMSEITTLYGTAVAGGGFTFANGGDLTCAASNGVINRDASGVYVVTFDLPSPSSATLRASTNTTPGVTNGRNIIVQNTGTFNMVGDYGIQNNNSAGRATIWVNSGSPTINIIGNITSSQTQVTTCSTLWIAGGTPTINITGNVSGGSTNTFNAANGNGIYSQVASTINITGNITTNIAPSVFIIGGILNVIGNVTGGNAYMAIQNVTTAATIDLLGITTSGSGYPAIQGLTTTFVKVRGNVVNTDTYAAIYAGRVTIDNNVTSWQFKDSTNTIIRTLYTAGVALGNPATNNVRLGTTYGASSELTGTLRVPTAANVLQGVLVDNTTGTLLMTPADFWNYLIASGFTADSIGDRLQNVATVATTGGQIASYNI
jgi:hypothetical protein